MFIYSFGYIIKMFKKIILWCEFPKQVDWKKAENLFKNMPLEIYVAVKSKKEYFKWKNKTKLELYPWPILPKSQGYWFSGFTSKKSIDKLNEFKGMKMKIDLEPPLPNWEYTTTKLILYGIKKIFQKGKNSDYLEKIINKVISKEEIIINEFPFPKWYLKRQGIYLKIKPYLTKNLMCYTSFAGKYWRPFVRFYLKIFIKKAIKKNPNIMFSVGLIGAGILKNEKIYSSPKELKQDLEMIHKSGAKIIAIYSLEAILKRSSPEEWIKNIKDYI